MNSKIYDGRQVTLKMNSYHLLNSVIDDKEAKPENVIYNNKYDFKYIDQSSNSDDYSALDRQGKGGSDPNWNSLLTNNLTDNKSTVKDMLKFKRINTSNSADNCHLRSFDTNFVTCSKNVEYSAVNNQSGIRREKNSLLHDNNYSKTNTAVKACVDKDTYCRPVYNFYNQEFIYKTISRNARLQRLLRKIVYVRQKEKQEERWHNFINVLKNKHGCPINERRNVRPPTPQNTVSPDMIDDYYNTRFHWQQSNQCQDLLENIYGTYGSCYPNVFSRPYDNNERSQPSSYIYENYPYCCPTSSQVHLLKRHRDMSMKTFDDSRRWFPLRRYFHENNYGRNGYNDRKHNRQPQPIKYYIESANKGATLKSSAIQTESKTKITSGDNVNDDINEETIKQKYERVSKNVNRLKKKIEKPHHNLQSQSVTKIENKLNDLIQSMNACLAEIKTNSNFKRSVVCGIAHNVSTSTLTLKNIGVCREKINKTCMSQFDDILYEELNKSNRIKRDIDDIINRQSGSPCAVDITFDIPTKERATEVTASLSKARLNVDKMVVVEEIEDSKAERMTIAVNTDPLGLLGLLKISTEIVKRILSYMPQIDYYSYLSMVQFPQCSRDGGVSHYVCNICGTAFGRPSQLSKHIQEHNLGKSRDCCVCRHVLNMSRHRSVELFTCRYCCQRFTRAYCCQLHEESCAKRLGAAHDVTSSLTLLR